MMSATAVVAADLSLEEKWEAAQREYGGKIRTFARNSYYKMTGYEVEDVEQELLVVLWECVMNYDPSKGARFNTYFQRSAKNRIITLIRYFSAKSRTATVNSLDEDSVRFAAEELLATYSAEQRVMDRLELAEVVEEHGEEVLYRQRALRSKSA